MTTTERVSTTVPLNWNEVWFTNCPMVSANNIDQELGWCREEYRKIGVEYAYFRHAPGPVQGIRWCSARYRWSRRTSTL